MLRFNILKLDDKLRENRENNRKRKMEIAEQIKLNNPTNPASLIKSHTAAVEYAKDLLSEKDADGKDRMFSDIEIAIHSRLPLDEVKALRLEEEKEIMFGTKNYSNRNNL